MPFRLSTVTRATDFSITPIEVPGRLCECPRLTPNQREATMGKKKDKRKKNKNQEVPETPATSEPTPAPTDSDQASDDGMPELDDTFSS